MASKPLSQLATRMGDVRTEIRKIVRRFEASLPAVVLRGLPLIAGFGLALVGLMLTTSELSLLNQFLILGLFGVAYNLLFGFTGLLSFGHAAFFGLGAYTTVFAVNQFNLALIPIALIAIALAAILSVVMGLIALRTTGVYFAMLTLAIAQLLYIITIRLQELGGTSGLAMIARPRTALPIDMGDEYQFFLLSLIVLVGSYLLIRRILASPVGDVFRAIRENEQRAEMVGYNVFYYKLASFSISGMFSALAGVLYGQFFYFAPPRFLFWTTSGDVLLQTLFGGASTLLGPIVGAGFVVLVEEFLSPITDRWLLIVGAIFILVVIFLPDGMVGFFTKDN